MLSRLSRDSKIWVICTILCIISNVFLGVNAMRYKSQEKATIDAVIVDIQEVTVTENRHTRIKYDIYVDYMFKGGMYSNIMADRLSELDGLKIGDHQEIEIYTDNPSEIAQDTGVNFIFFGGFSIVMIFISYKKIKQDLQES